MVVQDCHLNLDPNDVVGLWEHPKVFPFDNTQRSSDKLRKQNQRSSESAHLPEVRNIWSLCQTWVMLMITNIPGSVTRSIFESIDCCLFTLHVDIITSVIVIDEYPFVPNYLSTLIFIVFQITCPLSNSVHYSHVKGFYTAGRHCNMFQRVSYQDPIGFFEAASPVRKFSLSQICRSISSSFFLLTALCMCSYL